MAGKRSRVSVARLLAPLFAASITVGVVMVSDLVPTRGSNLSSAPRARSVWRLELVSLVKGSPPGSGFSTPIFAKSFVVAGNGAIGHPNGVRVMDVSDPSSPTVAAFVETPGYALQVASDGDLVFVADGAGGLRVLNIADPTSPGEVGSFDGVRPRLIAHVGDFVFTDDHYTRSGGSPARVGIAAVRISDPANPAEAAFFEMAVRPHGIHPIGNHLLLPTHDGVTPQLHIVDVSKPEMPHMVATLSGVDSPMCCYGDQYLLASSEDDPVWRLGAPTTTYDLAEPWNPVRIGPIEYSERCDDVRSDAILVPWASYDTVRVFAMESPTRLCEAARWDPPSSGHRFTLPAMKSDLLASATRPDGKSDLYLFRLTREDVHDDDGDDKEGEAEPGAELPPPLESTAEIETLVLPDSLPAAGGGHGRIDSQRRDPTLDRRRDP